MRLSKTSEYAIRCLVAMAHGSDRLHSAKALSEALGLPHKYLGRLLARLGSYGLIEGVQGKGGGYRIARPLDRISVADIVDAVEGLESYDRCILGFDTCDDENPCPLHGFWAGHKDGMLDTLRTVTVAQMAASVDRRL